MATVLYATLLIALAIWLMRYGSKIRKTEAIEEISGYERLDPAQRKPASIYFGRLMNSLGIALLLYVPLAYFSPTIRLIYAPVIAASVAIAYFYGMYRFRKRSDLTH